MQPSTSRHAALYLTYALMLFGFTSISSARVALSLYALTLGGSPADVGLVVSTLYIFPLVLSWPIGRYGDRVGSRWPIFAGAIFGACAMAIPFVFQRVAALYVA